MSRFRQGWGFEIDYVKAIAEDERCIAECDRAIAGGWIKPPEHAHTGVYFNLVWLALIDARVAADLGLSRYDLACVAEHYETRMALNLDDVELLAGWYRHGNEVAKRLMALYPDDLQPSIEALKARRAGFVAARGRHRRNAAKFGR